MLKGISRGGLVQPKTVSRSSTPKRMISGGVIKSSIVSSPKTMQKGGKVFASGPSGGSLQSNRPTTTNSFRKTSTRRNRLSDGRFITGRRIEGNGNGGRGGQCGCCGCDSKEAVDCSGPGCSPIGECYDPNDSGCECCNHMSDSDTVLV